MSSPLDEPIQSTGEPILQQPQNTAQPKTALKVSVPENSRPHDKFIPVPQTRSRDNSKSRSVNRNGIQSISREVPPYADPIHRPPPKPAEIPF